MGGSADGIFERMHDGDADIRKRQPRQRGAQRHAFARRQIIWVADCAAQMRPMSAMAFSATSRQVDVCPDRRCARPAGSGNSALSTAV